jgi:hypothetical protein
VGFLTEILAENSLSDWRLFRKQPRICTFVASRQSLSSCRSDARTEGSFG